MCEFTPNYQDNYGKLIEGLEKQKKEIKDAKHYTELPTNIPGAKFITEVDNFEFEYLNVVTPRYDKSKWQYTEKRK